MLSQRFIRGPVEKKSGGDLAFLDVFDKTLRVADGLAGDAIPLVARIIAVSDAYDAMISDRPYRRGMPREKALSILCSGSGVQWDPGLVPVFVEAVAHEGLSASAVGTLEAPGSRTST